MSHAPTPDEAPAGFPRRRRRVSCGPWPRLYPWFVFAHIVGVVLFAISHGASAFVAFRMRSDRDPHTVASLLAMSQLATGPMYVGLVLLGVGGIGAATIGGLWGEPWVIASVVVLLIVIGVMYSVASPYYVNLRKAVGAADAGPAAGRSRRARAHAPVASAGGARDRGNRGPAHPRLVDGAAARLSRAGAHVTESPTMRSTRSLLVVVGRPAVARRGLRHVQRRQRQRRPRQHRLDGRVHRWHGDPAGCPPTLVFAPDGLSGTTGCNSYGGTFRTDGDRITISVGAMTEMACDGPRGAQEARFSRPCRP